jgi:hypothetical protein
LGRKELGKHISPPFVPAKNEGVASIQSLSLIWAEFTAYCEYIIIIITIEEDFVTLP